MNHDDDMVVLLSKLIDSLFCAEISMRVIPSEDANTQQNPTDVPEQFGT